MNTVDAVLSSTDIAAAISTQARTSGALLLAHGWEGDGSTYALGAYGGDLEALETLLGRPVTREERLALEDGIRAHLTQADDAR